MSEVYYNTLTNKYVEMYVNTMNDHLKNASYKEYVFLGLHQKAINEINRLVSSLKEKKKPEKINLQLNIYCLLTVFDRAKIQ